MSQGGHDSSAATPTGGGPLGQDPFTAGPFAAPTPAGAPPRSPGAATVSAQPPGAPPEEANTLATLSVIFAFVFAPAGAVLGHLGLIQIARSGQRGRERALAGITLSYLFIIVAVVALVVWAAAGSNRDARSTSQGAPTPGNAPGTSAAPAPTTSAPTPAAPPVVSSSEMGALLLSLDEIKTFTGDPNMVSDKTYTKVEPPTPDQGSFEPADCLGSFAGGVPGRYEGTNHRGYLATTQIDMQTGLQTGQSVAIFDTAADAQKALANYRAYWQRCANTQGVFSPPGQPQITVTLGAPVDAGGGITTLVNVLAGSPATFTRAIAAKANVLIDNQVGGLDITDQNVRLTQRILERIPG